MCAEKHESFECHCNVSSRWPRVNLPFMCSEKKSMIHLRLTLSGAVTFAVPSNDLSYDSWFSAQEFIRSTVSSAGNLCWVKRNVDLCWIFNYVKYLLHSRKIKFVCDDVKQEQMRLMVLSQRNDWRNWWVMLAITFNLICCIFIRCFMLVIPFKSSVRSFTDVRWQPKFPSLLCKSDQHDDERVFSNNCFTGSTDEMRHHKNIILKWLAQTLLPSPHKHQTKTRASFDE